MSAGNCPQFVALLSSTFYLSTTRLTTGDCQSRMAMAVAVALTAVSAVVTAEMRRRKREGRLLCLDNQAHPP
jgi:hypothetical protein